MGNDWQNRMISGKCPASPSLFNAALALREASEWMGVLAFDEFSRTTMALVPPPWTMNRAGFEPRPWTNHDDKMTTEWLQAYRIMVPLNIAAQAVELVAVERSYHPVRDYLDAVTWDGMPRLDTWMIDYLGAEDNDYTRAVARTFMISAVARIAEPGCQVDSYPILEGRQGVGKSSAARLLFQPWFSDELGDIGSKDAALQLQGVWAIEISELDALSRPEATRTKSFLSRRVDRFRPPYGTRPQDYPRECVFIGTTNAASYLKDETGARRTQPITCTKVNLDGLDKVRDVLWAEATHLYRAGVAWHIVNPRVRQMAEDAAAARYTDDVWTDAVLEFIKQMNETSIPNILEDCLLVPVDRQGQVEQNRVARILRAHGWERFQKRDGDRRRWCYRRETATAKPKMGAAA